MRLLLVKYDVDMSECLLALLPKFNVPWQMTSVSPHICH